MQLCNRKDCAYVDEALFYVLQQLIPSVELLTLGPVFQSNISSFAPRVSFENFMNVLSLAPTLKSIRLESVAFQKIQDPTNVNVDFESQETLATLIMRNCGLVGRIPSFIGKLKNLKHLELQNYGKDVGTVTIPKNFWDL